MIAVKESNKAERKVGKLKKRRKEKREKIKKKLSLIIPSTSRVRVPVFQNKSS